VRRVSWMTAIALLALVGPVPTVWGAEVSTADFTKPAACEGTSVSHYTVSDAGAGAGMLSFATRYQCKNSNGSGTVGVCQLDQTLRCRSDVHLSDRSGREVDLSGYTVSAQGVTAAGVLHPWLDPQAAAPVMGRIKDAAARSAAANQAAVERLGGEENFGQFLMVNLCRIPLVAAGVVQPTAREKADQGNARKQGIKITPDVSAANIARCRTATHTFCARTDLPATITQTENYRTACRAGL
jgi:hypothetical protein